MRLTAEAYRRWVALVAASDPVAAQSGATPRRPVATAEQMQRLIELTVPYAGNGDPVDAADVSNLSYVTNWVQPTPQAQAMLDAALALPVRHGMTLIQLTSGPISVEPRPPPTPRTPSPFVLSWQFFEWLQR